MKERPTNKRKPSDYSAGAEDEPLTLELPRTMRRDKVWLPNTRAQLEFIDACGHAPNWEQPDRFAQLMDQFLPACFL